MYFCVKRQAKYGFLKDVESTIGQNIRYFFEVLNAAQGS